MKPTYQGPQPLPRDGHDPKPSLAADKADMEVEIETADPEVEADFQRAAASSDAQMVQPEPIPFLTVARAVRTSPAHQNQPRTPVSNATGWAIARENETVGRTEPHNIDAEQGLLGCLMLENGPEVLAECIKTGVTPSYFYQIEHQTIFGAMLALNLDGKGASDELQVANWLKDAGELDKIGGHGVLYELTKRVRTTIHAKEWLGIVRDKFIMRQLIRKGHWMVEQAMGAGAAPGTVPELVASVQKAIDDIQNSILGNGTSLRSIASYQMVQYNPNCLLGLDYLERGQFASLVAVTHVGKSTTCVQAACQLALDDDAKRHYFGIKAAFPLRSLIIQEEDSDQYVAACRESVYQGMGLSPDEIAQVNERVAVVWVGGCSGSSFFQQVKSLAEKHKADMVFINPISSYIAGTMKDDDVANEFFNGLSQVNPARKWAYFLVLPTPKPARDQKDEAASYDDMYKGFGAAAFATRIRAGLLLKPRAGMPGEFSLVFGKAASRTGVMQEVPQNGGVGFRLVPAKVVNIRHTQRTIKTPWGAEKPMLLWEESKMEADQGKGSGDKRGPAITYPEADLIACFPDSKQPLKPSAIYGRAKADLGISRAHFYREISALLTAGKIGRSPNGYYKA